MTDDTYIRFTTRDSLDGADPTTCQWFALCENPATTTRSHPVLGDVPICGRCDERIEAMEAG